VHEPTLRRRGWATPCRTARLRRPTLERPTCATRSAAVTASGYVSGAK
jgi:hypothetical protein